MSDEEEIEDEDGDEGYYAAHPELVYEESCLILDPADFEARYNAAAVQMKDGAMFVLDRDSHRWRNVEDFGKPASDGPRLKRVQ